MSQRMSRVDELLRQEIGVILGREVSDPRIGFVTVTKVETSPDLATARVWVSIIGTIEERRAALRALDHAMPYVRRVLGQRIRMRRIPELRVHHDDSIERGTRLLKIIGGLEAGTVPDPLATEPGGPAGESLPTPVPRLPHEGDAAEPGPGSGPDAPASQGRDDGTARGEGPRGAATSRSPRLTGGAPRHSATRGAGGLTRRPRNPRG